MPPVSTDILDTPEAGPAAVRGAALRVGGYLAGVLLSVASAALVLRYLGAATFGQYATIFSLIAIVMGLTDAPTSVIGVREWASREEDDRRQMLAHLMGIRLAITAIGVLVAIAFALVAPYTGAMVLGTALAGAGLLLTVAALTLIIPLQAELRMVPVTALELVRQAATVAVLFGLVALGAGIALLLGAPIAAGVVLLAGAVLVVDDRVPLLPRFEPAAWRALLADTLPYAAALAVGVVYSYVTIIVMSLVASHAETGYFGAAHRVFYVLATIPGLLASTALPVLVRAARDDRDRLRYAIQRIFEMQLVIGAGMAIVVAAGAPVAIAVVAGGDYDPAVPVLRLQAAALFATSLIALGAFALLTLRRYRALLVANLAALVTTAGLTVVLAESDGAQGAAVALIAGEVVLAGAYIVALTRAGLRPSPATMPRVALAAAPALVVGFALGLPAVPAAALAGLVFAGVAVVVRAVPVEAIEAFTSLRRGRRDEAAPSTPPPPSPT